MIFQSYSRGHDKGDDSVSIGLLTYAAVCRCIRCETRPAPRRAGMGRGAKDASAPGCDYLFRRMSRNL